jgi:very-short-patch-repair endonuclease
MENDLFLGASTLIFERAKALRLHLTEAEEKLWHRLRNNQMKGFRFRRQHPLLHYIADFYCHEARLVVELDGAVHEQTEQTQRDEGRTFDLSEYGIDVLRFTNQQVLNDTETVLNEISARLPASATRTRRPRP